MVEDVHRDHEIIRSGVLAHVPRGALMVGDEAQLAPQASEPLVVPVLLARCAPGLRGGKSTCYEQQYRRNECGDRPPAHQAPYDARGRRDPPC